MTEFSPPSRWTARVTKKQIREMQENYKKAAALAGDNSEIEAQEKDTELSELEKQLDDMV
jgi:hypothetical protein